MAIDMAITMIDAVMYCDKRESVDLWAGTCPVDPGASKPVKFLAVVE